MLETDDRVNVKDQGWAIPEKPSFWRLCVRFKIVSPFWLVFKRKPKGNQCHSGGLWFPMKGGAGGFLPRTAQGSPTA